MANTQCLRDAWSLDTASKQWTPLYLLNLQLWEPFGLKRIAEGGVKWDACGGPDMLLRMADAGPYVNMNVCEHMHYADRVNAYTRSADCIYTQPTE